MIHYNGYKIQVNTYTGSFYFFDGNGRLIKATTLEDMKRIIDALVAKVAV